MAAGDDDRAIFDHAALDRQTGGDASLRTEIVQMFLEDCPARVEEMRAAIAGGNAPALASSAHALKGSAAYLSASIVRGRAADLERMGHGNDLAGAPMVLEQLDAAVADLLAALKKI